MRVILALCLCWCAACGWCAEPDPVQIRAEVDRQTATTDDLITCKIIITSSLRQTASPQLPDFRGFAVISQASSSTVSMKEGAVKSVLVMAFVLLPVQTGSLTIGPAALTVDGRQYASQPLTIQVSQGTRRPEPAPAPSVPRSDLPRYSL